MNGTPHFTRDTLPQDGWRRYRKTTPTWMIEVSGPFSVQTREGAVLQAEGFLAIDADGYPYPVAGEMFVNTYEAIDDKRKKDASLDDVRADFYGQQAADSETPADETQESEG